MKRLIHDLTIRQSILAAFLGIVLSILSLTGLIFYTSFSQQTDLMIEDHSREINKQIVYNYENYINSVIETANYIQYITSGFDVRDSYDYLQDKYLINTEIKKDVVSVYLFDTEGRRVLGNEVSENSAHTITAQRWFTAALQERLIFHFSAEDRQSLLPKNEEHVISVSRYAEYIEGGQQKRGVLLIELNSNTINELAEKTNLGPTGHIIIIDDDDSLINTLGSYELDQLDMSMAIAVESYYGGFMTEIDHKTMYMNITPLSNTRWRIVNVIDVDHTAQVKRQMLLTLLMIFVVSIFVAAVVSVAMSRRISNPLNTLKESMRSIEQGSFHSKVVVTGQREVVHLSETFNSMIDTIQSLMERILNEQREKRKTELRALQNQINPHFLYNTLDSIIWLAENDRSEDVITTVSALARFFRISISGGENFITLEDEIQHVRNYLTIQKVRYQKKFEYRFEVDREVVGLKVMKLILQPLVENAINYGIGDEQETITLRCFRREDSLILEVENTGYGITDERIREIYRIINGTDKTTSVGLRNVYLRLKLYYGAAADLIISSSLDVSTTMQVVIPVREPVQAIENQEEVT
ncbi:MAG: sensor histidine kinase [Spirochaetia bacterium]|nr:sensor histidine kinase [Spirochaetia bacterium]MCF7942695.1 sensor histidine kinase [Spirochaetia bacterium]